MASEKGRRLKEPCGTVIRSQVACIQPVSAFLAERVLKTLRFFKGNLL